MLLPLLFPALDGMAETLSEIKSICGFYIFAILRNAMWNERTSWNNIAAKRYYDILSRSHDHLEIWEARSTSEIPSYLYACPQSSLLVVAAKFN